MISSSFVQEPIDAEFRDKFNYVYEEFGGKGERVLG